MAKRYGRRSGGRVRGGYGRRAGSARRVQSRGRRSGSRGGARRSGGTQHTVRIVMEHPSANPMLTVPVGRVVETPAANGGKSRF